VRLRVLGKQAHGSRPELGINAIEKMVKVLQAIRRLRLSYELHPLLGRPTLSINTIQGGVKTNIVPASCEVTIDIRTVPGQTLRDVMNQIKGVVRELERKDRELRVRVEKVLYGVPIEVGEEEPVVRALSSAIEEVVGRKARIVGTPGGTVRKEMVGKLPVGVIYGPGEPKVCHMANEYIRIADLLSGARIYALTILKLLS
jgi:acetylornithine deacetylase/succinyl-diaminopimelate desuccinylase-like protein